THGNNHDRVVIHGEVAGQIAGDVDGALNLCDGALPGFLVARGQVYQKVTGKEVGQVGGEGHVELTVKDLIDIDFKILVGEVELQEVGLGVLDQRLVVVVADGQAPGA